MNTSEILLLHWHVERERERERERVGFTSQAQRKFRLCEKFSMSAVLFLVVIRYRLNRKRNKTDESWPFVCVRWTIKKSISFVKKFAFAILIEISPKSIFIFLAIFFFKSHLLVLIKIHLVFCLCVFPKQTLRIPWISIPLEYCFINTKMEERFGSLRILFSRNLTT